MDSLQIKISSIICAFHDLSIDRFISTFLISPCFPVGFIPIDSATAMLK